MKSTGRISGIGLLCLSLVLLLPASALTATKDTLVYVMGAEVVSLDPPNQTDSLSETVIKHIYDIPIHLNAEGALVPRLFSKWEHSPDGKMWTFYLQKGVKFHDGTPCNAEAVKFNWERGASPEKKVIRRGMFTPWAQNIKVIDELIIQVATKEPFAPILRFLTHALMGIVSPAALKKYGEQINRNPVGSGPFRFVEWVAGDRLVLERNEDYWGPKPKYKQLVFKFVKESSARVMMLETGEDDLVLKIPPVDIERLKSNPNVEVLVKPSNRVIGFFVNTIAPLTNDLRFRQALAYAIDKDSIIKHVMKGIARPCCSVIGGGTFGESTPKCYEYNPQKAKDLLKEVGYKGDKVQIWTPQGRYTMDRETSEAVQAYWTQAGINVDFHVMEFASIDKGMLLPPDKVKFQTVLLGAGPSTGDGDQILRERYVSEYMPPNGRNSSFYKNPDYDKLAEAQAIELDEAKRKELMKQCQDILARDLPFIPLYTSDQVVGIRKNLKGVEILPVEMSLVWNTYFQN